MRRQETQKLYKTLLPQLQQFVTDGRKLLLIAPIGDTLRGVLVDSSSYSRENFYLNWFFMPMCHPINYFILSYGDRIHQPDGNGGWDFLDPELVSKMVTSIREQAMPALLKLNSTNNVISEIRARAHKDDCNAQSDIAYLHILQGEFSEAENALKKIVAIEGPNNRQWEKDIVDESKLLLAKLSSDPLSAFGIIRGWQNECFKNLKLEKWR